MAFRATSFWEHLAQGTWWQKQFQPIRWKNVRTFLFSAGQCRGKRTSAWKHWLRGWQSHNVFFSLDWKQLVQNPKLDEVLVGANDKQKHSCIRLNVSNTFYLHPEPWGRFPCWRMFFQLGWNRLIYIYYIFVRFFHGFLLIFAWIKELENKNYVNSQRSPAC